MSDLRSDLFIFLILFFLISFFFLNLISINTGYYTDSYIIFRIVKNFNLLFLEEGSNIYNENIGYPFLIFLVKLFGISVENAALFINYLFLLIGVYLFYKLLLKASGSKEASFFTMLFLLVNPIVQYWALRPMADILFMNLLILFVYLSFIKKDILLFVVFFVMLFIRSETVVLIPYLAFYRKEKIKKRILILPVVLIVYFLAVFSFKSGGKVNFILLYKTFFDIPFLTNLINHTKSLIYNFGFSGVLFFVSGLGCYFYFEKDKLNIYRVLYLVFAYFSMNVMWKYVQFRHWLPFIPFFIFIYVYFFRQLFIMCRGKYRNSVFIIYLLLIILAIYWNNISVNRIRGLKDAFSDNYQAGKYISKLEADLIISNIDESMIYFNDKAKYIRFDEVEWIPNVLTELGEKKKIYAILADRKFKTRIQWDEVFKEIKVFSTKYNFIYPSVPGFRAENSWGWLALKDDEIVQKTRIYEFDQKYFLFYYAMEFYGRKNYKQAVFYFEKLLNLISDPKPELLEYIKKSYYFIAMNEEDKMKAKKYAEKALKIEINPDLNDDLKSIINR